MLEAVLGGAVQIGLVRLVERLAHFTAHPRTRECADRDGRQLALTAADLAAGQGTEAGADDGAERLFRVVLHVVGASGSQQTGHGQDTEPHANGFEGGF